MSYYVINVARYTGRFTAVGDRQSTHYFATSTHSITSERAAKALYHHFRELFPADQYEVEVTYWSLTGVRLDIEAANAGWHPGSEDDEHTDHPATEWADQVEAGLTRESYVEWVNRRIAELEAMTPPEE